MPTISAAKGICHMLRPSVLAAVACSALSATTASAASPPLIVAPQPGAVTKASPTTVTVRAPYGARTLRVTLNGRDITSSLGDPDARARRTLRVSASHGLRFGRNVLRVVRRDREGARVRRATRTFTLTRDRPLVGAGVDRSVVVGAPTRLNARASRSRRAPKPAVAAQAAAQAGTPAGLGMQWKLISKPRGSAVTLEQPELSLIQPADNLLKPNANSAAQPARPLIKPDRAGRYVAALTVTDGKVASAVDTVTLTATFDTPLVPIDTAATVQGQQGIAIGYHPAKQGGRAPQGAEQFYPKSGSLQAVILDRESLQLQQTFNQSASNASIIQLAELVRGLDDNALVIIAAWSDPAWATTLNPTFLLTNLGGPAQLIGAQPAGGITPDVDPLIKGATISFAGVNGFSPGDGWQITGTSPDQSLNGFLSPDNNDNYAYLGTAPQPFDMGADGQSVSLSLGSQTYNASLPSGQGGFTAVYLDATTLQPSPGAPSTLPVQATYQTANADGTPNISEVQRMAGDLSAAQKVRPTMFVAVRSIGTQPLAGVGLQPPAYAGPFNAPYASALDGLAAAIAGVGGQAQRIWGMATPPAATNSYTLIGRGGSFGEAPAQGSGTDIGTAMSPAPSSVHMRGVLVRDRQQRYEVRGAANGPFGTSLAQLMVAEPTAWPFTDTPAGLAALQCIGYAQRLGSDPRTAYWTSTNDSSDWNNIKQAINQMQASDCPSVDPGLFGQVQQQLVTEIGWLVQVQSYIPSLMSTFSDSKLSTFTDLKSISDQVKQAVKPPPQANAGTSLLTIFGDALDLVNDFLGDEVSAVTGPISAGFVLAGDLFAPGQGAAPIDWNERITTASDNLGDALATQLDDISDTSENLVDIIAADYTKLSTVGQLGGCSGGPGCTAEWQFTQDQQNALSRMYEVNAERKIWGGILPAAYPYVLQTNSNTNSFNGTFQGPQEQISSIGCDFAQPFPINSPSFLRYGIRQTGNTWFLAFSQLDFKGANSKTQTFPPTKLLQRPFNPLDPGGNPSKGGLGLDQFGFMVDNWPVATGAKNQQPILKSWRGC